MPRSPKPSTLERLLGKIEINHRTGCWEWNGAKDKYGYGKMKMKSDRQPTKAHRISFELHIGQIPPYKFGSLKGDKKPLLHSCDNPACINPNHLIPGTHHTNAYDRDNPFASDRTQSHNDMANLNKVMLLGNLTRDPEIRFTAKQVCIAELGLAINNRYPDGNGGWKEETTFVDVTCFGRTAENAEKFLKKGRGVYVEGRLQLDQWEDKTSGEKRSKLKVVAQDVQFLPSKEVNESSARARETATQRQQREAAQNQGASDPFGQEEEDDIPF